METPGAFCYLKEAPGVSASSFENNRIVLNSFNHESQEKKLDS